MPIEHNPDYIHHVDSRLSSFVREIVFGLEDGMVSTLGAVTGIAAATQDPFTTILAGFVVVSVESISMGAGSFLSSKSKKEIDERKMYEESIELKKFPKEEKIELVKMYVEDGWPRKLAENMASTASKDKKLFLKEMSYRELQIIPDNLEKPFGNAIAMGISYIMGGLVPVLPYLVLPFLFAIPVSIGLALFGLFALGVFTTRFTKRIWWKAGFELLGIASFAALAGYVVGQLVEKILIF